MDAPFGTQALTPGEVAQAYGVTPKVLRSWFRAYGLEKLVGRRASRYFTPAELRNIADTLGTPESHREP